MVVLWSTHSVESEWVKNEAAVATERGVLVPALLDNVKLPLEFRRKQTADLIGWEGTPSHGGFHALCEGIAASMGSAAPRQPVHRKEQNLRGSPPWVLAGIIGVAITVGLIVYAIRPWQTLTPAPQSYRSESSKPSESKQAENTKSRTAVGELADLVVGKYYGEAIADSKGSSRSDVAVTITKIAGFQSACDFRLSEIRHCRHHAHSGRQPDR